MSAEYPNAATVSRREFLRRSTAVAAGSMIATSLGGFLPAHAQSRSLNWLTFSIYEVPEVLGGFQPAIKPVAFDDFPAMYLKLKQGGLGTYDVAIGDSYWPRQMLQEELIKPFDISSLTSASGLAPQFKNFDLWTSDKGQLLFPNMWGVQPIVYRKDAVPSFDSWEVLWDKKFAGRILMMDQPSSFIPCVAMYLGFPDPFELSDDQLAQVKKKLMEHRPYVKSFFGTSADFVTAMALGEGDLGFSTSPGVVKRVKTANGPECGYTIPKEGTVGWADGNMLIPQSSSEQDALRWINYFGSPEVQAKLAMKISCATANEAAVKLLEDNGHADLVASLGNKDWDVLQRLKLLRMPKNMDQWLAVWNEYKAG